MKTQVALPSDDGDIVGKSNARIDHADDCVSGNHPMTGAQAPTSKPSGRMLRAGQFLKGSTKAKAMPLSRSQNRCNTGNPQ